MVDNLALPLIPQHAFHYIPKPLNGRVLANLKHTIGSQREVRMFKKFP